MDIKSIILKKQKNLELTSDEIKYFVSKCENGEISDVQIASLVSYIVVSGLTINEIADLSLAISEYGDKFNLNVINENIIDIYSTGGVGEKINIILIPLLVLLDIPVAKICTKDYGISEGLIDRLESIPGFNTDIGLDKFVQDVKVNKCSISNQLLNFAPLEKRLYEIRKALGFNGSLPLIAVSLLSLKLAMGAKKIVFDITCGKCTYIKDKFEARKLANILCEVGNKVGREVICIINERNEPAGYSIGYNLEITEIIEFLKGKKEIEDLKEIVTKMAITIANFSEKRVTAREIRELFRSNKVYSKFKEIILKQGGNEKYLENTELFQKSKYVLPVFSTENGFIDSIDLDIVSSISTYLGAGRMKNEYEINYSAGIVLEKKVGDFVSDGEIVAYVHTNDENKISGAIENLKSAFKYTNKKHFEKNNGIEIIGLNIIKKRRKERNG